MPYNTSAVGPASGPAYVDYLGRLGPNQNSGPLDEDHVFAAQAQQILSDPLQLQASQTQFVTRSNQLIKLSQSLAGLKDAATGLQDTQGLLTFAASSDSPSVVKATLSGRTSPGSYQVVLRQAAAAQSNSSKTYTNINSSPLADGNTTGSLVVQVGSQAATTFAVDANTTLASLSQTINASGGAFISQVVNQGGGSALILSSTSTGTANALTIRENALNLQLNNNPIQAAQDALGSVNNVAFDNPTNLLSGAIPGVTLQFLAPSSTPATVAVTDSSAALSQFINAFVAAFNAVMVQADIMGEDNASIDALSTTLARDITSASVTATGSATTLAEIGVTLTPQNTLVIDNGLLSQAIAQDAMGVATLFANGPWGAQKGLADTIAAVANDYGEPGVGLLAQAAQSNAEAASRLQSPIDASTYASEQLVDTLHDTYTHLKVTESELSSQNLEVNGLLQQLGHPNDGSKSLLYDAPPSEPNTSSIWPSSTP